MRRRYDTEDDDPDVDAYTDADPDPRPAADRLSSPRSGTGALTNVNLVARATGIAGRTAGSHGGLGVLMDICSRTPQAGSP